MFIAPHWVPSVSQRSRRMAPTSVRLSPQCIGWSSTSTVPRRSHACERSMARLAPDSSMNTSRRESTQPACLREERLGNLLKMTQALPSSLPTKSQKLLKNASDQIAALS